MATNHVQQPDPNASMFGDGGHEQFGYNPAAFPHASVANSNWAVDPSLHDRSQPFSPTPAASAYPTQAWQPSSTPTPTPTSLTPTQHQQQYNASRGYFTGAGATGPTPFQNTSPYVGYGLPQYQHQTALDPSLGGSTSAESRTFSQPMAMFPSTSPSNTVSPSALHSGGALQGNRHGPPLSQAQPVTSLAPGERKLSSGSQIMSPQAPQAIRPPSVNGYVQSQLPKQPKGIVSGKFILIDADELSKATRSVRLHNFVNIGSQQYDIPITKSTVPPYTARKSQNELKALAAIDPSLKEKMLKRVKKSKVVLSKKQPKSVNGAARLSGSKESPMSTSSASDSSDYDSDFSSDSDSEVAEPSPLPATRPQAALEAVRYDTIKAVWLPRNVYAPADSIRAGLAEFWEVTKTIRDRWRTDSDAVKAATEANKIGELPLLKERVDKQRDMLQAALKAAIAHGHPDIMRLCGTIKSLMYVLYQFLVERIKANDYESDFTKTNLKFLSLCTGLNTEMAALTGLDKVFTRILKRGDAEGKALSTKITENATSESNKTALESSKTVESPKTTKVADSKDNVKKEPKPVAGTKRPSSAAGVSTPAAKRVTSTTSTSVTAAGKGGLLKQPPSTGAVGTASSATAASKAKGHQVVTKPPVNFFSGLQSASKKPGTSLSTAKPKITPGAPEKKSAAPAPVARSTFSFAETMANLTRVQEPESSKPEVKRPPETAEEKARRLRKEERRKLRVTWKPDAVLVEVKLFSRDPSEMPSNATNVRDVRDGKEKEGLMFKQHMEMQDVDEDDDQPMELSFFDFKAPTLIDFSHMESDVRTNNYEPYGGGEKKVDSPERLLQENREANTLMVHYMVKSDIPPCPREPADPYTGEHIETKMFGAPDDPQTLQRLSRFAPPPAAVPDVSALLANLHSLLPQPQAPVQPPPMDPNAALQNLLSNQFGLGTPQPSPAPAPAPPAQEQPTYDENSIEAILAKLSAPAQPQPAQAQPPAPALQTYTSMDQNALLAALVNQTQQNPYVAPNGASPATDGYDSQPDRKRGRDEHDANQTGGKDANKRQKWNSKPHSGPKFIYECRFYKKGECKKGADCTYRHEN